MRLKQLVEIRTGLSLERKRGATYDDFYKKYQAITLKSFGDDIYLTSDYLDEFIATEELNPQYLTSVGDIIVRLRSPNKAVFITDGYQGLIFPAFMSIIRILDKSKVDGEFLAYYLNSNLAHSKLANKANGTAIPMIKNSDLADLEIELPSIDRQKNIVRYMKLANQEINILNELISEKTQLKNKMFETAITKAKGLK